MKSNQRPKKESRFSNANSPEWAVWWAIRDCYFRSSLAVISLPLMFPVIMTSSSFSEILKDLFGISAKKEATCVTSGKASRVRHSHVKPKHTTWSQNSEVESAAIFCCPFFEFYKGFRIGKSESAPKISHNFSAAKASPHLQSLFGKLPITSW